MYILVAVLVLNGNIQTFQISNLNKTECANAAVHVTKEFGAFHPVTSCLRRD